VASTAAAVLAVPKTEMPAEQRQAQRNWADADVAAARSRLRDYRSRGGTLDQRWQQALADAGRQGLTDFWIVYTFTTPTHAGDVMFSDTRDGGFSISSNGQFWTDGPPLNAVLDFSAVPLEGGPVAVAMHHRSGRADAIDRAAYLSLQLGLNFGRAPVFWLGDAAEAESFARVQNLFGQASTEKLQVLLIELASLHSDTNVVAPFLSRLVQAPWPPAIRSEAAEGFEHHHDPRSVEILLRVARTDPDSSVRSEAAETIGEVQTPQSIAALTELTRESDDPDVRREAAEGFADQPAAQALPALESVIATSRDEDVLGEAVEALGDLDDPAALPILVQIASAHANASAQQEAVETIGDLDVAGVVDALTKMAWEHPNATIRDEAVETLGDRKDDARAVAAVERILREHPDEQTQVEAIGTLAEMSAEAIPAQILELVESGRSPLIRREAIEEIADALDKIVDARALDSAEQILERAIYNDPDTSVRMEALDALGDLPGDRADRALRKIADGHPDARVRREAAEHLRKE
jgi:HEAT repeat protein